MTCHRIARQTAPRIWPATLAVLCALFAWSNPLPGFLGDRPAPLLSPAFFTIAALAAAAATIRPRLRPLAALLVVMVATGRATALFVHGLPGTGETHHSAAAGWFWLTLALAAVEIELRRARHPVDP